MSIIPYEIIPFETNMDAIKQFLDDGKDFVEDAADYVDCELGNPKISQLMDFDRDCNDLIEFDYNGVEYGFPAWLFWGLAMVVVFLLIVLCNLCCRR